MSSRRSSDRAAWPGSSRGTIGSSNRTVAVKVLSPQFADDDQFVARFRREAQAAAGLNHPNIVSVYDTGSQGDVHFIVMEYVEGRTLRDIIRQDGPCFPSGPSRSPRRWPVGSTLRTGPGSSTGT